MPTESIAGDIKRRSAWSMLMGVLTALLGLFLIAYPMATAAVTTLLLGWILIFVAIAQIVFAFHSHTTGGFFSKILLAVLYGIAGIGLALFPVAGVAALVIITAAGNTRIEEIAGAARMKTAHGDIEIGAAGDSLDAFTSSGSIRVSRADHGTSCSLSRHSWWATWSSTSR